MHLDEKHPQDRRRDFAALGKYLQSIARSPTRGPQPRLQRDDRVVTKWGTDKTEEPTKRITKSRHRGARRHAKTPPKSAAAASPPSTPPSENDTTNRGAKMEQESLNGLVLFALQNFIFDSPTASNFIHQTKTTRATLLPPFLLRIFVLTSIIVYSCSGCHDR